jgi:hypothetical protein
MDEAESTAAVEADEDPVSAMEDAIESVPEASEEDDA